MTFVDHLKGVAGEQILLAVAFGRHVIAGTLAKSIVTGVSPTHIVTIEQLLGDALGKGWSGVEGIWYAGTNRPSTKYKFYPGIMSPGNADATQGIDATFDQDTPHSNTAWIRVECPSGSEVGIPDFDTKNNPPTAFSGIFACQLGDVYDASGSVSASNQLLTNPADVIGFGCKQIRRYSTSRVDWSSLDALRTYCNLTETPDYTTLPQGVGLTGDYYEGTSFGTLKHTRVDPVIEYDLSTGAPALDITPTSFSVRWRGKIKARYSETYTFTIIHNDSAKLIINGVTLFSVGTSGTDTATFAMTADQYYDIQLEWTNAASDSQFTFEWNSTSQALQVVPQEYLFPYAASVPKFRTNIAFTERTTFDDFLRSVLFTCNGGFQDTNGMLTFFSIDNLSSSFAFTESNIIKDTFKFYPRYTQQELLSLPNRFVAEGRDLESRFLERFDPPLYYDDLDLQSVAGRVIEETVNVGNTTRWQGLKNLAFHAHLKRAPMVCEFEGMPETLKVLQGDLVTVTHSLPGWSGKEFLTIEATDKAITSGPDGRIFKMYSWDD